MEQNKLPDGKFVKRCYGMPDIRVDANSNVIEGHAAVYGQITNIGDWFYEIIEQGAFDRADISDVAFFFNHDMNKLPMARSRKSIPNSTMKVGADTVGLAMSATVDIENNSEARALKSAIMRQDVTGMSFAFLIGDEEWAGLDTDMPTRTIKSVSKVFEVSAVTWPAYEGTDINARSNSLESDRAALERAKGAIDNKNKEQKNQENLLLRKRKLKMKEMY